MFQTSALAFSLVKYFGAVTIKNLHALDMKFFSTILNLVVFSMPTINRIVKPGSRSGTVVTEDGEVLIPPGDWSLLPPGDATLTKRVKAMGPTWLVQVKVRRRLMSKGIWANSEHIGIAEKEIADMRATPEYAKKRARARVARDKKQKEYVRLFFREVIEFLDFHQRYTNLAEKLAREVTEFATPVGSGTVARTSRIPPAERARAAVIAWLRHKTTNYDRMSIPRVKGQRREVRRRLATASLKLLDQYRLGQDVKESSCPLQKALV